MDLSMLALLKEKLQTAEKFHDIVDHFLTHIGSDPEILKAGERIDDEFLPTIIKKSTESLYSGKSFVSHVLLTRVRGQQFIHGTCIINGNLATVLYFEDIHKGLVTIAEFGGMCQYIRFTAQRMPMGTHRATPSKN